MESLRCDICGGVVLHDEAKGYSHADPQQRDHLAFAVPQTCADKPGDRETDNPTGEEGGGQCRQGE